MSVSKSFAYLLFGLSVSMPVYSVSFSEAWTQVLQTSDKLHAEQAVLDNALAEQDASSALAWPELNVSARYTYMQQPLALDIKDLNPIASLKLNTLTQQHQLITDLSQALAQLNTVTPFTQQDIFNTSLQAMWPIYTGGKITAAHGIHAALVQEKQQQMLLTQRELFLQLVERYYGVEVSVAASQLQLSLMNALQHHAEQAEKLEQQGQIAKVERLNAQVALENAKVNYNRSKRQTGMAQLALTKLLKIQPANLFHYFL